VENQSQQLIEFCERMGWQVVAEFSDTKSGKSLDRPGFKKMMEAASRREFDVLVFWDLSRLSRGGVSETLRVLEQVKAWGIAYLSIRPRTDAYFASQATHTETPGNRYRVDALPPVKDKPYLKSPGAGTCSITGALDLVGSATVWSPATGWEWLPRSHWATV
jgi:Resolvase, N terminal domain